jgi:hypothetical protein
MQRRSRAALTEGERERVGQCPGQPEHEVELSGRDPEQVSRCLVAEGGAYSASQEDK